MSDKSDFGKKIKQLEARIVQLEKSKGKPSKPKKKRKPSAYNLFFKTEMHKKVCERSDARENKITILQFTEYIKDQIHELYSNTKCSQKNKEEEGCIAT